MQTIRVGLAGCGALGSIIADGLMKGIPGYQLIGIAEKKQLDLVVPIMRFDELAEQADLIIEALPPDVVPKLANAVLPHGKKLLLLSVAALSRFPEILKSRDPGQLLITSGGIGGIDAVRAFALRGLKSAKLVSTKPPHALAGAPYVLEHKMNMASVTSPLRIFAGNAAEAAQGFPANVNVGVTLALACRAPGLDKLFDISVEIWADPMAIGNTHKIIVETHQGALLESEIFSPPSPINPKSSPQAAYAVLAHLHGGGGAFAV